MEQILKFGKFKGSKFSETPSWYQEWLPKQDWYKPQTNNEARYDVVRKYTHEYGMGMGIWREVEVENLSWNEAEQEKNNLNMGYLDDITECYYIENRKN